ncbi:fibrinogen gamma chain-like [Asterias rubens]|uniref:fibrinogen gamma chain-like n=1 Tax=Asterias rubens TaxID=7604 RepID=UPI001455BABB|nr:fibrinogen gamma chain-like [Asterias rubens]
MYVSVAQHTAAPTTTEFQPIDCWDIQTNSPLSISGEYTVYPARRTGSLQVYCDMDSDEGGWTVFQRRVDNSQDFDLTWAEYKAGFGDLTKNFWLGNDALNELTSDRVYQLRIEMQSFSLVSMAVKYGHFRVDTESNLYRLDIGTFYGSYDAGDSLGPTNSQPFSTKDRDNDDDFRHCAQTYLGPWWYKACIYACLNCPYINTDYVPYVGQGVVWGAWLDLYHSMKFAEMKIRPVEAMKGKDCYDLLMMGETISGVYNINVEGRDQPLSVYCEMVNAGGGWTVFQRRVDGSQDFYLSWADYKAGFGDLTREFWLGNDDLHLLSNQRRYELIVIVKDWVGNALYALYDEFSITDEGDLYRLSVGSYTGTAGDSLTTIHHGMAWSTHDRDNDLDSGRQCAQTMLGAWWYNACDMSNLNGVYVPYPGSVAITGQGVIWGTAGYQSNSFYQTEMKIRPAEVGF